jgi:hypothetical protein
MSFILGYDVSFEFLQFRMEGRTYDARSRQDGASSRSCQGQGGRLPLPQLFPRASYFCWAF